MRGHLCVVPVLSCSSKPFNCCIMPAKHQPTPGRWVPHHTGAAASPCWATCCCSFTIVTVLQLARMPCGCCRMMCHAVPSSTVQAAAGLAAVWCQQARP